MNVRESTTFKHWARLAPPKANAKLTKREKIIAKLP